MTTVETAPCLFCGRTTVLELPFSAVRALAAGTPVQDVLPDMPPPEREVIISGVHPECFPS